MGVIHVLDKKVADLIAAGEVVERPASIVKELVENAVDAGADSVTVEFSGSGAPYIRVSDNGRGMSPQDAEMAVLRHATSKIRTGEDLTAISTLGFRGEALAAISAVSKMNIITCEKGSGEGISVCFEAGDAVSREAVGCPQGTTVIVRDVFFNTPARMKFLKKDTTEAGAIVDTAQNLALSRPDVSIKLIRDGSIVFNTPGGGDMAGTVYSVLGADVFNGFLELKYNYNGIDVTGYTCRPENARFNRSGQYFFLNGRCIRSRTICAAMEEAYRDSIMTRRFPAGVVYISVSPQTCDVNVHPAKTEVKFFSDKSIFDAVYFAVKTALSNNDKKPSLAGAVKKQMVIDTPQGLAAITAAAAHDREMRRTDSLYVGKKPSIDVYAARPPYSESERRATALRSPSMPYDTGGETKAPAATEYIEENEAAESEKKLELTETTVPASVGGYEAPVPKPKAEEAPQVGADEPVIAEVLEKKPRIVGEVFDTFIIVQNGDEMYLIDKHAAHERIIYERLLANKAEAQGQLLLEPVVVPLRAQELSCAMENADIFERAGFEIDEFGSNSLIVRQVPVELDGSDIKQLVMEMVDAVKRGSSDPRTSVEERIYHTVACKAAIKAGKTSQPMQLEALVDELLRLGSIRYCPHGRPVAAILTRSDIEKQLGRQG